VTGLLTRSDVRLHPDARRVVARLFVPGHEHFSAGQSRATGVLRRVLDLPDEQVEATRRDVLRRFGGRHRDLPGLLRRHYGQIAHRVPDDAVLDAAHQDLVGAFFTNEFTIEGAALFSPSVVLHPDQSGVAAGCCRLLLSLRAVGEGHLSCIEFRTALLGPGPTLVIDEPGRHAETAGAEPTWHDRALFDALLHEAGADEESCRYLRSQLGERFDEPTLGEALDALEGQQVTRAGGAYTAELARALARCAYEVTFPAESSIAERVLWPQTPLERAGLEDLRLVRFVDDDRTVSYLGTYTAFDGSRIAPQLLRTDDFQTFRMSQLAGPAAKDKGFALFPRKVAGRWVALSRSDRESSGVATSGDGVRWGVPVPLQPPVETWELLQTGNCGSPVETSAGWLVLTHGVGPMREYSLGALLLDLDDPTRVIGQLPEPLLAPAEDERDGYVPNVVYSCGSVAFGDVLLLPYGASDVSVRFAFVDLPALLARMTTAANSAS
jgi:predicted GH43/DUF377 family glycosyl hydrolase